MACIIEEQQALLCENSHLWEVFKDGEYEFMSKINQGAYGVVYKARDIKSGEIVAVKEEVRGVCQSTLMEIAILKSLPPHPCIVGFKRAAVETEELSVFVVMEHMDMDLQNYLEKRRRPLMVNEIKHIMRRILEGLSFLHQQGVIHRDIKPRNILVKGTLDELKICDFGLSARVTAAEAGSVGTQEYMAPEAVAGGIRHTSAVDMWSAGCIMAELVLKQMLLPERQGGVDEQLVYIIENLALLQRKMKTKIATLTPSGFDLLKRLLAYQPGHRITAQDALNHPWFSQI